MKKIVSLLLILSLSMILAVSVSAQDTVEITFVHIFGVSEGQENEDVRIAVITGIAEEFMAQNPGVVVNIESSTTDYTELFNNALSAAQQGNAPHIVQVEEGLTQLAADSGLFVPIADVASEEQLASLDDILPQIRDYYSIQGQLLSLPWNSSNPILYYNRGVFAEAGLDPDSPPSTFAELLSACEAIMAADLGLDACANWPMAAWFAEQWVAMQGGLLADNDNGRSARATEMLYASDEMLAVANFFADLAENDYYTYSGVVNDYNGEGSTFLTGRTAITINSTAGVSNFVNFSNILGVELGVAPLPLPTEDATNGGTVGGASLWLSAGYSDAETQASIDFMFFLTNTENEMNWHMGSGYFPNRQSSIDQLTENGWFDENPFYRVAIDQLVQSGNNIANAGAVAGPSSTVRGYLIEAFQSIIDGGSDPLEALQVASERANEELEIYNSIFGD